ncbi:MAG: hypothetical protein ABJL67_23400 [Sulfitobacter sp.]
MTENEQTDELNLEGLFEAARRTPAKVPEGLMARVIADASAVQPVRRFARWRGWLRGLGGMPAISGLVTATCVGFWLGVAPPTGLPDLGGAMLGVEADAEDTVDVLDASGFGWDIEEG